MEDIMNIYKITNKIDGKIYIGQTTKSLQQRFSKHFQEAQCTAKGMRPSTYFHNALIKYGKENFTISLLDTADSLEELNKKEIYWINKLNALDKKIGYNLQAGGKSGKKSYETRQKIRERKIENWQNPELAAKMRAGLRKGTKKWQQIAESQRIELICPVCEKSFRVPKHIADEGRKYCSKDCAAKVSIFKATQQAAIVNRTRAKERRSLLKKDIEDWAKNNKELIFSCPFNRISTHLIGIQEISIEKHGIQDWRTISQAVANTNSRKEMLKYLQKFCENVC